MTETKKAARTKRMQHRLAANDFLEQHSGPVLGLLADVVEDLGEEIEGLNQFQQDVELAAELAFRLDNAITLPNAVAEALDGVIAFFVALAAIGIWRAVARQEKLRGKRILKLKERLQNRGAKMLPGHRRRLERRIKRLERMEARKT